jgi:hypothetical protein
VRLTAAVTNEPMDKNSGVYYDLLVYAKRYGTQSDFDMVKAEMRKQGRSDATIESGFLQRMRVIEPLVREGQDYLRDTDVSGIQRTVAALVKQGYEENDANKMLHSELDYVNGKLKDLQDAEGTEKDKIYKDMAERGYTKAYLDSLPAPEGEKTEGERTVTMFTYDNLTTAISRGNKKEVDTILAQFKADGKDNSTIQTQVTGAFKPLYYEAFLSKDTREMARIEKVLLDNTTFYKKTTKENDFTDWLESSHYGDIYKAIDGNDASAAAKIRASLLTVKGVKSSDVRDRIKNKYGPKYKELYKTDKTKAAALKKTLVSLGFDGSFVDTWVNKKWD